MSLANHPASPGGRVTAQNPDPAAFSPFGAFLEPPAEVGERVMFGEWLEPVPGLSQQCHLNRVAPSTLPITLDRVEMHPRAAQLFLPTGNVSRYLVTVLPADDNGAPDPDQALAFVLPGTLGVAYRPGTWHSGIVALDAEASFAVLMWRGGKEDDVFAPIPPLEVHFPISRAGKHPRDEPVDSLGSVPRDLARG